MKLKPYQKTKPSGVEWLGDVPEHWEVKRLKYSVSINDDTLTETTPPDFEFEYVDIGSVNSVEGIAATEQLVFENAPSRARRRVKDGDTIVSTVRTYLRAIAPIRKPPENLIVSTGFAVVRPRSVESGFLAYALRESSFVESVVSISTGVSYPAVNASDVLGIAIPLPSSSEQTAIAAYLDRETGRIDALVAKKRELIERLKEKRTALISRTVTRGLPPAAAKAAGLPVNPKMKDSGIEWLGEIPLHWEPRRLKDVGTLKGGAGFPHEEQGLEDEELPFYKVGDLKASLDGRVMTKPEHTISKETARKLRAAIIPPDSIVYAKIGAALLLNRRRVTFVDCCIDNNMTAYLPDKRRIRSEWAFYWLSILDFGEFMNPGAVPSFSEGYQAILPILLPPLPEQSAIAAYLDRETAKLDALVAKVEEAVERLQEYRTALITAAVTGKIDVSRQGEKP